MTEVDEFWNGFEKPITSADEYIASLRGRDLNVFFLGERIREPVDHPVVFPSINAVVETYRLAAEQP
jgi:4-hydroxybutyryl-CoA dehydratase/vinylacetyl-CoA-Delta-isomerase